MNFINEIEISYNRKPSKKHTLQKLSESSQVYEVLLENWNLDTMDLVEEFKVLLLNNANQLNGIYTSSIGGLTQCLVDIRLLFGVVLKSASTKIILAHNHPTGKLEPSQADIALTRKIQKAAKILDIEILDHLIITSKGYYSFVDRGLFS